MDLPSILSQLAYLNAELSATEVSEAKSLQDVQMLLEKHKNAQQEKKDSTTTQSVDELKAKNEALDKRTLVLQAKVRFFEQETLKLFNQISDNQKELAAFNKVKKENFEFRIKNRELHLELDTLRLSLQEKTEVEENIKKQNARLSLTRTKTLKSLDRKKEELDLKEEEIERLKNKLNTNTLKLTEGQLLQQVEEKEDTIQKMKSESQFKEDQILYLTNANSELERISGEYKILLDNARQQIGNLQKKNIEEYPFINLFIYNFH